MSEIETIEATDEPRRRGQRGPDKVPRRPAKFRPQDAIQAAGKAGYGKVRMTVDSDGKITLEMGKAADLPAENGEQNEWDARLDQLEKNRGE